MWSFARRRWFAGWFLLSAAVCLAGDALPGTRAWAADVPMLLPLGETVFEDGPSASISDTKDISAVTIVGNYLFLVNDEGTEPLIQLRAQGDGIRYAVERRLSPPTQTDSDKEIDLEGLDRDGTDGKMLYALGSCCRGRKKLEDNKTVDKNRERLGDVNDAANRDALYRFSVDRETGKLGPFKMISLRKHLENDPVLRNYRGPATKENGIDAEGLAVHGGTVYVGLRGPVVENRFAAVARFEFDRPEDLKVLFVELGGQGIRSLTSADNGLLLISGPVGAGSEPQRVWWWNGKDCTPGIDRKGVVVPVGDIPSNGGKAEGLELLKQSNGDWEILIVYDGLPKGGPQRFKATKPPAAMK